MAPSLRPASTDQCLEGPNSTGVACTGAAQANSSSHNRGDFPASRRAGTQRTKQESSQGRVAGEKSGGEQWPCLFKQRPLSLATLRGAKCCKGRIADDGGWALNQAGTRNLPFGPLSSDVIRIWDTTPRQAVRGPFFNGPYQVSVVLWREISC